MLRGADFKFLKNFVYKLFNLLLKHLKNALRESLFKKISLTPISGLVKLHGAYIPLSWTLQGRGQKNCLVIPSMCQSSLKKLPPVGNSECCLSLQQTLKLPLLFHYITFKTLT